MTSFASLMALAATNTRESQLAVEHAMQERRLKEALQKKQQEEKEAKERELEKRRRLKFFEEERKRKERAERLEAERKAKEALLQRREEEHRNALLYGPKKAAKMSSSSSSGSPKYPSRDGATRKRRPDDSDDDGPQGIVLTREEIRERKLQADMRRQFQGSKRSTHGGQYMRVGKTLPGGAVNIVLNPDTASPTPPPSDPPANGKPIKERLLQGPNALLRLATEKRDQRSVDEAQTDIRIKMGKATTKVLSGDQARNFQDWFSTSKKASPAPAPAPSSTTSSADSSTRKAITPAPTSKSDSSMQKKASTISRPASAKPIPSTSKSSAVASRASSSEKYLPSSSSSQNKLPKINKASSSAPTQRPTAQSQNRSKRPRSPSLSESPPPPPKRRPKERLDDGADKANIRNAIWEMFGKNRDEYAARDVLSDDEDMEADADDLAREEAISMRVAKREDLAALEEERRHEEEKRRRKREKERALARDY